MRRPARGGRVTAVGGCAQAVRRLLWSQLRFRAGRALALLAGMLVGGHGVHRPEAAAAHLSGPHHRHGERALPAAYDMLVPRRGKDQPGAGHGTVQADFLSGAPAGSPWTSCANGNPRRAGRGADRHGRVHLRERGLPGCNCPPPTSPVRPSVLPGTTTWVTGNGATRIPEPRLVRLRHPGPGPISSISATTPETLPDRSTVTPCPA